MTHVDLQQFFAAVVCWHLSDEEWQLVAVQSLATLPSPLQADLRRTFAVESAAVVLVLEPERKAVP